MREGAWPFMIEHTAGRTGAPYAMNDLSVALAHNDQFQEVTDLCREARELAIAANGPDAPITLIISMNLSTALRETGKKDEAKELVQHVLESQRRILPPDHPSIAGTLLQCAHMCGAAGDIEGAISALEEALDIQIRSMGEGSFRVAETRLSLSSIYVHQKEFDKAEELLDLAFDSVKPTWCEHPAFERTLQEAILELQRLRNQSAKVKDWEKQFDALRCDPAESSLAE
ncbi:MAG: tetratricopeptide repeat protein [Planctomycetes bacterium]|nr:tetratricopeptide repeat protein [Planctomycetota bacterium]